MESENGKKYTNSNRLDGSLPTGGFYVFRGNQVPVIEDRGRCAPHPA